MARPRTLAYAPSNIAWVKYMGKLDASEGKNLPENPSLSMTLDGLRTWVSVGEGAGVSSWVAESPIPEDPRAQVPTLKPEGQARILAHADHVARALPARLPGWRFRAVGPLELRTANTFPAGAGIASSASSFAATTLAVAAWLSGETVRLRDALKERDPVVTRALSELAREGSGSACRSIEGPFTIWEDRSARTIPSRLPALTHFVILLSRNEKEVSSSQAHARVKASALWPGRVDRAASRARKLRVAIEAGDFAACAKIAGEDSREMHELFHTAKPPFSYQTEESRAALKELAWIEPTALFTMDAGPNIHVTVPAAQDAVWREHLHSRFGAERLLEDTPGAGAGVMRWS